MLLDIWTTSLRGRLLAITVRGICFPMYTELLGLENKFAFSMAKWCVVRCAVVFMSDSTVSSPKPCIFNADGFHGKWSSWVNSLQVEYLEN